MKTSKAKGKTTVNKTAQYKPGQIYQTKDYDLFEMHPCNRDLRHDKILAESMRKHGFMPSCAIHVKSNGPAHMIVLRGHHRLAEAKRQKLPVHFIVDNIENDIFNLEASSHSVWNSKDWATAHKNNGNEQYQMLLDFQSAHGIPLGSAAVLLQGKCANGHDSTTALKKGTFKIGDTKHAKAVVKITDACFCAGMEFARGKAFLAAISSALFVPEFNASTFIGKVNNNPKMIRKCSKRDEYLDEVENLYNFRSSEKRIPLKFLTLEALRVQKDTFGGKQKSGGVKPE